MPPDEGRKAEVAVTKFPSGLQIKTFKPPPPRFNPLKATDAELIRHGFPRRPKEDKAAMERYDAMLRRLKDNFHYIVPTFERHEDKQHRPLKRITEGQETSSNWSGAVAYATSGHSVRWVEGNWTVPNVYAPAQNSWYHCSNWIGIDGDGSGDVCQAGVECEVYQSGSSLTRTIYPWWEWFPEYEIAITNFKVSAGDEVTCLICSSGAGATTASVYFTNASSGASTSFSISAPGQTKLVGNCADWIVEAPTVNGSLAKLADYGSVFFFDAQGHDGSQTLYAGQGNDMDMVDDGGKVISDGILDTPTVVQCLYTG
jgi:Peptidase A4 family